MGHPEPGRAMPASPDASLAMAGDGPATDARAVDTSTAGVPSGDVEHVRAFLAEHHTLVVATVADGQPWCTRVFFAEAFDNDGGGDHALPTLYLLAKTPSRKLANLRANDRVGIFVGPEQPTAWFEARGHAVVLADERAAAARERVLAKAPEAGPFLARVTAESVRIRLDWLRLTDVRVEPRRVIELGKE